MPSIYRQAAAIVCVAFLACTADARPKPASEHTRGIQAEALGNLPDKLEREIRFASQGFIATRPDGRISQADGSLSADLTNMSFLQGDAPATVHPALWQHSALTARHGLFKVNDGIYQVRGFDVSNITFISSDNGWIVVDPLTVNESSAAALSLLREHVDQRPIKAVIYTHPHTDHFAGVGGIIEATQVVSGEVEVIAPEGFMHELVQEWIIAGNAMGRRGFYQFGLDLPAGEHANVGIGMGPFVPFGEQTLIPPTTLVSQPVQTLMIDGLEVVFLLTPGAEAPVEFNFYIPRYKALCTAETATSSLHNVLTLRGAAVRDAKAWADSLTATADLFPEAELVFMTHHWPRFGNEEVMEFLGKQRDTYKYLHDQSVRLMNLGYGPAEIAERIKLPSTLAQEWYNRGFYGSLSHNAKAVYQKYMGWYSGVPADLNPHTPVERAHRYIAAMGGATGSERWRREPMTWVITAGQQKLAITWCSTKPWTKPDANCWPAPTNNSATKPRARYGVTST